MVRLVLSINRVTVLIAVVVFDLDDCNQVCQVPAEGYSSQAIFRGLFGSRDLSSFDGLPRFRR